MQELPGYGQAGYRECCTALERLEVLFVQCFTIHGCVATSSSEIRWSGLITSSFSQLAPVGFAECHSHTLLIRSPASGLTKSGIFISALMIRL